MGKNPGVINRFRNASGFTIVELLIVVAVIGILAAIAFPRVDGYLDKARTARARADIDNILKAMVLLEADTGLWPGHQTVNQINQNGGNEVWNFAASSAGLRLSDGGYPNWNGPYMSSIPLDPWGNRYFMDTDYMVNGQWRVVLGSFGPNGCCPNQYDDDDVIKVLW
jgi:general secretion pathway protein G